MIIQENKYRLLAHIARDDNPDLVSFTKNIFSLSYSKFVGGDYVERSMNDLAEHDRLIVIASRDHFKSTRLYAEVMHTILSTKSDVQIAYFSYTPRQAQHHLKELHNLISNNSVFFLCKNLKPQAEFILEYENDYGFRTSVQPHGILTSARGIHVDYLYLDDPLTDIPLHSKLQPTQIIKVNESVQNQILAMPRKNAKVRVVGTTQTHHDFFYDENITTSFTVKKEPAIVNDKPIWPEFWSMSRLISREKEIGSRAFRQEYLTEPSYSTHSFLDRDLVNQCVDKKLRQAQERPEEATFVVAGVDIGKKAHPTHIAIFAVIDERYVMLYERFLENMNYTDQLAILQSLSEQYKIDQIKIDNTRSEFEIFKERDELPSGTQLITITPKLKQELAGRIDQVITNQNVSFLNRNRYLSQLLMVTSDLQAIETDQGHADSFYSTALALSCRTRPVTIMWV